MILTTRPRSAVGNVSDCRYTSNCRSRVEEFDPAGSHIFVEPDYKTSSMAILFPYAGSRMAAVSYKRKYVHKVLVNHLVQLAQEKSVVS